MHINKKENLCDLKVGCYHSLLIWVCEARGTIFTRAPPSLGDLSCTSCRSLQCLTHSLLISFPLLLLTNDSVVSVVCVANGLLVVVRAVLSVRIELHAMGHD